MNTPNTTELTSKYPKLAKRIRNKLNRHGCSLNEEQFILIKDECSKVSANVLRDLIMQAICEHEPTSGEQEDACNLIYDDLYRIVEHVLNQELHQ